MLFLPKTRDGDSRSVGTAADPFKYFLSLLVPTLIQIQKLFSKGYRNMRGYIEGGKYILKTILIYLFLIMSSTDEADLG